MRYETVIILEIQCNDLSYATLSFLKSIKPVYTDNKIGEHLYDIDDIPVIDDTFLDKVKEEVEKITILLRDNGAYMFRLVIN